jgi:hypothetical protein
LGVLLWHAQIAMSPYYSDTHPDIDELQIRLLRQTAPWRKMQMLAALNRSARQLATIGLKRRFPDADEQEIRRRLADLLLGEELAAKDYGKPDYKW